MKENIQNKINACKRLSFAEKAILCDVATFEIGKNQPFDETDNYLSEKWGSPLRTIERTISNLKKFEILKSHVIKKKHFEGDKVVYNKRYISVDFQFLTDFLNASEVEPMTKTEELKVKDVLSLEEMHSAILKNNSKEGKGSVIKHYNDNRHAMSHDEIIWVYNEIMS